MGNILNTDLPSHCEEIQGIAMSTGFKEDGTTCKLLPLSAKFPEFFVNYVGELSAAPGSHGASNPKNKLPLEVGKLPTRPKVKISQDY